MSAQETAPLGARRILVVDDQPSIRGVLKVALEEAGADVWTAPDGTTALRALESGLPDLILLDLVMPGMNGWQVVDALRSSPRTAHIPIVLETSAVDYASFDRARRQGIAAFISKPFRLNEIVETCRRILSGGRPLQGKDPRPAPQAPAMQVRDLRGSLIAMGRLLEKDARGAQAELERPLSLGQMVLLTFPDPDGTETVQAEVRWVTRAELEYHHGFAIRAPRP